MELMESIWKMAKNDKKKIVLAEGEEKRNLQACDKILKNGLANIVLVGSEEKVRENAKNLGLDISGAEILDPNTSDFTEGYAKEFYELRKKKGMTLEKAEKMVRDPLYFATMAIKTGYVDGMVSGAIHTTGDLLRPGLQIVKTAPGVKIVSGFFVMMVPDCKYGESGLLLFADCAVNPNPTAEELAAIAITTAETAKKLCNLDPKVAMLSFSTMGSAKGELVEKVQKATAIAKEMRTDLDIDGELQLDAAIEEEVAQLKAPGSPVAGKANVLVFPDLQTGNIGYKLVQRFAKAKAIGPICQGFAKPINDLSRGCSSDDIVNVVAMTAVQAQKGI
ncbi:phosphate acetyltransferase [Clostridium pasteurianum DSM 525 = ATCC 6013]|uniref:Phosphate acetyltransferase n=1 Tax=Clostridium pasteurianum DSM 525 = ATCC 6013 TaxID=1262449 RepID=A0A0H3J8C1_CLOPA|nr:phosphate acetyltransferase [Clostridium pasteurianum]AJA48153.1 phosphate acetyltransferase [Clostridium pasteurianum DSM 525 = ATCC 6013]AJA52141.1 phosphate acetyltransferase [Clostridium pasteurianum DSM 525 = ATCC 6013]AOZ75415.1 phosphate acetyltransferase [Clostridium pasteurianum DSM 525 = ATCC 6013]AOZ79210.1 phosphate acetyltransferase [Clostridium pasteurianum]ELP60695.1 phosphotransacetylase [Clostridium pasteurianum DSM 525 = ATCC 6013]